jgi:hypothetical protein
MSMCIATEQDYEASVSRLDRLTQALLLTPDGTETEEQFNEIYALFEALDTYELEQLG